MKRVRTIIIGVIVVGGLISVLLHNRAQITAKSRVEVPAGVPVSVATVARQNVAETLSLTGTIVASNDVPIVAEAQGKVTKVYAEIGDYRRAGDPILQLDDELKRAELEKADVNYQRAKKDMERFQSLRDEHAATDVQKENAWQAFKVAEAQLVTAKRQYRDTRITTPISGIVTARTADVGTMVNTNAVVANVVDISRLKVRLNVSEKDAFKMKKGDRVEVTTVVYPGVTFAGTIASISAKADEAHTYPVEISLPNSADHPLRAGMFGRVTFVAMAGDAGLTIPREALVGSLKQPQVFVVDGGDRARLRPIVVLREVGTDLVVSGGLAEGETVVVNGQNNLKDSVAVEVVR